MHIFPAFLRRYDSASLASPQQRSVSTCEAPRRGERGTPRGSCRRARRRPPRRGEQSEREGESAKPPPARRGGAWARGERNRARPDERDGRATGGESERQRRVGGPSHGEPGQRRRQRRGRPEHRGHRGSCAASGQRMRATVGSVIPASLRVQAAAPARHRRQGCRHPCRLQPRRLQTFLKDASLSRALSDKSIARTSKEFQIWFRSLIVFA